MTLKDNMIFLKIKMVYIGIIFTGLEQYFGHKFVTSISSLYQSFHTNTNYVYFYVLFNKFLNYVSQCLYAGRTIPKLYVFNLFKIIHKRT